MDKLLEVEAETTLKFITSHLAKKWKEPYSRTYGYVKSRMAITLVSSTYRCIRGTRVPVPQIRVPRFQWEYGAGLHLFG